MLAGNLLLFSKKEQMFVVSRETRGGRAKLKEQTNRFT